MYCNFYRRITIIRRFNDLGKPRNRKERQASGRMSRERVRRKFPQTRLRYTFFFKLHSQHPSSTRVKHARTFILWFKLPFYSTSIQHEWSTLATKPDLLIIFPRKVFGAKTKISHPWWRGDQASRHPRRQEIRVTPRRFHPTRYKTQTTQQPSLSPDTFASFQPWALREEYRRSHPRGISSLASVETAIPPRWRLPFSAEVFSVSGFDFFFFLITFKNFYDTFKTFRK